MTNRHRDESNIGAAPKRRLRIERRRGRHRRLRLEHLESRRMLAVDVLYIGDGGSDSVQSFDAVSGAHLGSFVPGGGAGLRGPRGMVINDGNLLVVNQNVNTEFNGEVLRFAVDTGNAVDPIVPASSAAAPFAPRGIVVRDNVLYVADFFASPSRVAKYNATDGTFLGNLIPDGFNAEFNPRGLVFGPDGKLYVTVYSAIESVVFSENAPGYVLRFDDTNTGAFEVIAFNDGDETILPSEIAALHNPEGIAFDSDGRLYVTSFRPDRSGNGIVVVDPTSKTNVDFIPLGGQNYAQGLLFGPDDGLFIPINGGEDAGAVRKYDVTDGTFDVFVDRATNALEMPWYLTFGNTNPATLAYEAAAPVVTITSGNPGGLPDREIPGLGTGPTTWARQRSDLRVVMIDLPDPITTPTAADLTLRNLGIGGTGVPQHVALTNGQITLSPDGLQLTLTFAAGELADGVYQLVIGGTVTGGSPLTITGTQENKFFVLRGDWNGDGVVSNRDFPTFSFWFLNEAPPEYVDLRAPTGINAQDFTLFLQSINMEMFPTVSSQAETEAIREGELASRLPAPANPANPADVNGDRSFNACDALNVINAVERSESSDEPARAEMDANRDGRVSAADAVFVINQVPEDAVMSAPDDDANDAVDRLLADEEFLAGLF